MLYANSGVWIKYSNREHVQSAFLYYYLQSLCNEMVEAEAGLRGCFSLACKHFGAWEQKTPTRGSRRGPFSFRSFPPPPFFFLNFQKIRIFLLRAPESCQACVCVCLCDGNYSPRYLEEGGWQGKLVPQTLNALALLSLPAW